MGSASTDGTESGSVKRKGLVVSDSEDDSDTVDPIEPLSSGGKRIRIDVYSSDKAVALLYKSGISEHNLIKLGKFLDTPIAPGRTFSSDWTSGLAFKFFRDIVDF